MTGSVAGEVGQVFVSGKSPGFDPLTVMLKIVSAAEPLLVIVIGCAAVLLPTVTLLNASDVGENAIAGVSGISVPESAALSASWTNVVLSVAEKTNCADTGRPAGGGLGSLGANCTVRVHEVFGRSACDTAPQGVTGPGTI